jgi:hypothetical protein
VLKIVQFLVAVSPTLLSIWLVLHLAVHGLFGGEEAPELGRVYGRFMGGSASNGHSLSRVGQSRHFMQIAQGRINAGDCAYR